MRVSEQQILMMYQVLMGTTNIKGTLGGFSRESRIQLTNNIMNQQSKVIKDYDGDSTKE